MGKEQYKGKDIRGERQPLKWHALRRFEVKPYPLKPPVFCFLDI